jgi:hypothetical protein
LTIAIVLILVSTSLLLSQLARSPAHRLEDDLITEMRKRLKFVKEGMTPKEVDQILELSRFHILKGQLNGAYTYTDYQLTPTCTLTVHFVWMPYLSRRIDLGWALKEAKLIPAG